MLVNGGRARWARVVWLAIVGSAAALLAAGCGSRTSMLDPDAYSTEGPGAGGSRNDPNAVDPSRSTSACASYCKGFEATCADTLDGRDCRETCAAEVNGKGKECQSLGIATLECLAPFFSARNVSCAKATSNGQNACHQQLTRFAKCASPSTPMMPNPNPNPRPGQPGLVKDCTASVTTQSDLCIRVYSCRDGRYIVECVSQLDGTFACGCSFASGVGQGAVYGPVADPCQVAGTDCGFY